MGGRRAFVILMLVLAVFTGTCAGAEGFRQELISPDWAEVGDFDASDDHFLIEDGAGALHLFYNNLNLEAYHRVLGADGAWSEPERIVEGVNSAGYGAAVAPDGAVCFVWLEMARMKSGDSEVLNNILHVKRYLGGAWQDAGEVYDYGAKSGGFGFNFAGFQIAFDPEGALHVLFGTIGTYGVPETRGLFLDGEQLTIQGERGLTAEALVPAIGKIEEARLVIGGDGVFHLIGMDTDSLDPDSLVYAFDRCVHSLSRDGGKTWEGPYTVFDGDCEILQLGVAEDGAGALHMMASRMTNDQAALLTTVLRPADYAADAVEYWFDDAWAEALSDLPWEERVRYESPSIERFVLDQSGTPRYFGESYDSKLLEFRPMGGGAWAARAIALPEGVRLGSLLPRRNGNLLIEAVRRDGTGGLLIAEIPLG